MHGRFKDLTNQKFGRLTALKLIGRNKHNQFIWECICTCGSKVIVPIGDLGSGHTKSCGCLKKENKSNFKHGLTRTRFYRIWGNLKTRCLNKNGQDYEGYGNRGITVSDNWKTSFDCFMSDMHESYIKHVEEFGESNTSIDRIDNNLGYFRDNCRWATCKEQANNRRVNPSQKRFKAISPTGEEFVDNNKKQFALKHGLNRECIGKCLKGIYKQNKGWKFNYIEKGEK